MIDSLLDDALICVVISDVQIGEDVQLDCLEVFSQVVLYDFYNLTYFALHLRITNPRPPSYVDAYVSQMLDHLASIVSSKLPCLSIGYPPVSDFCRCSRPADSLCNGRQRAVYGVCPETCTQDQLLRIQKQHPCVGAVIKCGGLSIFDILIITWAKVKKQ